MKTPISPLSLPVLATGMHVKKKAMVEANAELKAAVDGAVTSKEQQMSNIALDINLVNEAASVSLCLWPGRI